MLCTFCDSNDIGDEYLMHSQSRINPHQRASGLFVIINNVAFNKTVLNSLLNT